MADYIADYSTVNTSAAPLPGAKERHTQQLSKILFQQMLQLNSVEASRKAV